MRIRRIVVRSVLFGLVAIFGLLALYFLIMRLGSGSWTFTLGELYRLRFWITPLILGFGIQIGLFSYLKDYQKVGNKEKGAAMTSTTTSSVAMVACCAHHLSDLLPIIGLSVVAVFLVKFQVWFLAFGIVSNVVGILIMIRQLKQMKK